LLAAYPSGRMRARARFVIALNYLSKDTKRRRTIEKFGLLQEGIIIYNEHLKAQQGFVLCEPWRFYNYAKLALSLNDQINHLKSCLESLADLMNETTGKPLDFVRLLKEMANESTTVKELYREIDAEPKPIRKWFAKNYESVLVVVVPIAILVITYVLHLY
jgi:hypothetical protein